MMETWSFRYPENEELTMKSDMEKWMERNSVPKPRNWLLIGIVTFLAIMFGGLIIQFVIAKLTSPI